MSCVDVNVKIKNIKRQFLCGVPLKSFDWNDVFPDFSEEIQGRIISETVNSALVLQYPLKISYQREFVRVIIDQLVRQGAVDVADIVYEAFGRLVALSDVSSKHYKHYSCVGGKIVSLNEEDSFISSGTTGLCTWTAALALSDWVFENPEVVSGKTVLELGSGIGFGGLSIAANCGPKKVYLTDCHKAVLDRLEYNSSLNRDVLGEGVVEVLKLAWEDANSEYCKDLGVDVVLAADVVYDPDLFPSLVEAISGFLLCSNCKAYIACTVRNLDTLQGFLKFLGNRLNTR